MQRKMAVVLVADVAGYSQLMEADEEGTLRRVQSHIHELIEPKLAEHHGRLVKTTGDGLLAEFQSVVDAVRFALDVQRAMAERNAGLADTRRLAFRIGINLGDVIAENGDLYGDGVNVAARLEGLADPGGVMLSERPTINSRGMSRPDFSFSVSSGSRTSRSRCGSIGF